MDETASCTVAPMYTGSCYGDVVPSFVYDLITATSNGGIFSSNSEAFTSELLELLKRCTQ